VELSVDAGATWRAATLAASPPAAWVPWTLEWEAPAPGAYTLVVRAQGRDGVRQVAPDAPVGDVVEAFRTLFSAKERILRVVGNSYKGDEIELVIVFGRECHNVSETDALNYVAGYATGNDFSARDLQSLTSQFMIGKTHDGFAPLGPYMVTSDLIPDPNNLRLETSVNGETRQDWNTNDMIFNCRQLISFASKMMTIKPGDIFFTGTPQGVILGMPPEKRVWLKAGDKVACSLEKLGELRFELT
jgi:hypothetical protein